MMKAVGARDRQVAGIYLALVAGYGVLALLVAVPLAAVAAYAFSPIDLIPDFIPVLGYLDDLILVPAGIALALRLIPPDVLAECRERAQARLAEGRPVNRWAAAVIILIWLGAAGLGAAALWRWWT